MIPSIHILKSSKNFVNVISVIWSVFNYIKIFQIFVSLIIQKYFNVSVIGP